MIDPQRCHNRFIRHTLSILLFPMLFISMLVAVILFHEQLWTIATSTEKLRLWVHSFGTLAPIVFVAVQIIQVIIFAIPGEVPQIAGGFLFGVAGGITLTTLGIAIGSGIAFSASRLFGPAFLQALIRKEKLEKIRQIASSPRAIATIFLFFLIPGIPKDIICYAAGLSRMSFWVFIIVSSIGRTPGIVGSVLMGNSAARQQWIFAGIILVISLSLFAIGLILRKRISKFLENFAEKKIPDQKNIPN